MSQWVGRSTVDPDDVVWDAWRRDDGRWQVEASWPDGSDVRSARFAFDPAGRSVAPDDDEARAISGDRMPEPDLPAGPARLSVVGRSVADLPPDDDADDLVAPEAAAADDNGSGDERDPAGDERDPADDEPTGPLPVTRRPRRDAPRSADSDRLRLTDIANRVEVDDGAPATDNGFDPGQAAGTAAKRPASSRSRRPTVPSWDEIMFGRRRKPD